MAAVHAGMCEAQCSLCQDDPSLKEYWGCEKPTQAPVWVMGEDEFHSCPLLFISGHAVDWYNEYSYVSDFGGMGYDVVPARWYEAWQTYRSAFGDANKARAEMERAKRDGANKMRQVWPFQSTHR